MGAPAWMKFCNTCGNPLPRNYTYTVCVGCRVKCSKANNGVGNHEYVTSLDSGCVCKFCGAKMGEVFRGFNEDE